MSFNDASRRIVDFKMDQSALLLHFDAVNPGGGDAHYYIDSSKYNHPISREADAHSAVDITDFKFGPGSLRGKGGDAFETVRIFWRAHPGLQLIGDFTFDLWFKGDNFGVGGGAWDPADLASFGAVLRYDNWGLDDPKNNKLEIGISDFNGIVSLYCLFRDKQGVFHC